MRTSLIAGLLAPFVILLAVASVAGDEPPASGPAAPSSPAAPAAPPASPPAPAPTPAPAPDAEPKPIPVPAPDSAGKPPTPELHKIYVPFKDLQKVFEKEGQGVFVPYPEFRALWEKAYKLPDDPARPPVAAAVRSAVYAGVADGETIRFTAQLELDVLAPGWQRLPLDFGNVGIEKATIGGAPALLVPTEKGYDLLLEGAGPRTLELVFRVGAPLDGETHDVRMTLPSVPLARLSVRVPGTDTDVQVVPRLAGSAGATADGATELLAYLGPVTNVRLTWRRRPDVRTKVDPLVFATETTDVLVDRGVVRTEFAAVISILRAPLDALTLAVPADAVVLFVEGNGIRTWERNAAGDRIAVVLREAVKESWALKVGLERPVKALPAELPLPLVGIERLERETGFLRLRAAEGVKVDPRATPGLVQTDLSALPDPLKGATPGKAFGWRHPARPGTVTVAVEALAPRVSAVVGNRVGLRPEGIDVRFQAAVGVERAGIFGVEFDVPAALEVTDVQVKGAELDDWTRVPGAAGTEILKVAFRDRLLGNVTIFVSGRLALLVPEEEGREALFDVPLVRIRGAEHVRGFVALHADPALDRRETSRVGLTVLEADAPSALEPPSLPGAASPLAARLEHREAPPSLGLAVKRKAATVTGSVETAVRLEPDRTRLDVRLVWQVQFRGVDTFRFRGPIELGGRVHLAPKQTGMDLLGPVAEAKPDGAKADWKPARTTWTLKLAAPREGRVEAVFVVDDLPEKPLVAGASRSVALPVFVPYGADGKPLPNSTLHAAIRRDPLLEVATEKVEHGEEIDARELANVTALAAPETFLAFRSYDPAHAVTLRVTKHEYEPVAEVVISHMHLNTVVPAEGPATTEAFLVVRNNDRQYLELRLPEGASFRAVTVDGKPEALRRGEDGTVRIPLLANLGKDEAFVVALAYDHAVERSGFFFQTVTLASPVPLRVTSDLLTWRIHLPKEREVTSFGGDLEPAENEAGWVFGLLESGSRFLLKRRPEGRPVNLGAMLFDLERGSPFKVQADGRAYWFSNRTGIGSLSATTVNPTAFLYLRLLCVAAAFVGARLLVRAFARRRHPALLAFGAPAFLLLVLLVPVRRGWNDVLTAMLLGVVVAALVSVFVFFWKRRSTAVAATRRMHASVVAPPPPIPAAPLPSAEWSSESATEPPAEPPTEPPAPPAGGEA